MRIYKLFSVFFIACFTLSSAVGAANYTYTTSVDSQSMEAVLLYYCQTTNPATKCGVYQYEITQAQLRANQLVNIMRSYSSQDRKVVLEGLLERISRAFYNASDTNTKVIAAFYYMYFSQESTASADDLVSLLFDNGNTPREYRPIVTQPVYTTPLYNNNNNYYNNSGLIQNVWSTNQYTRVQSNEKNISLTSYLRNIGVSVRTTVSNSNSSNNYRVVASFPGVSQAYAGNYTNSGTWDFTFGRQFSDERSVTFSLLCQNCSGGSTYNKTGFRGWKQIDSVTYSLDVDDYRYNNNRYDYRYDDCDEYRRYDSRYCDDYDDDDYDDYRYRDADLSVKHVAYNYKNYSNDIVIELTTTVRNNSAYEADLDNLDYTVEINNRRVRENSDYKIFHKRTQCDDSNVRSSNGEDIIIEGYDECEITVEIRFERNLYNDDVEVEVEIDSRDDTNSANNSKSVSFRLR